MINIKDIVRALKEIEHKERTPLANKVLKELETKDYEITLDSGFRTYDGPGVCSFCGSVQCSGNCFK